MVEGRIPSPPVEATDALPVNFNRRKDTMPICAADKEGGPRQVYLAKGTSSNHTVTEWMTGYLSCTCPDWRMRRNLYIDHTRDAPRNNHCKHIHEVLEGFADRWSGYTRDAQAYETRTRRVPSRIAPSPTTGRAITLGDEEV